MFRIAIPMLIALALASGRAHAQKPRYFDPDEIYRVALADAPTRGRADALVTIVEFSDFACPFCSRAQEVLEELALLYPDQVRFAFRHNPLDPATGTLAAEAAVAAAEQGRFWAMHDRLYATRGRGDRAAMDAHARALDLDMTAFARALDSGAARAAVLRDSGDAVAMGVLSTPYFFVNGRPVRGAQPLSVFVRIVEEELARARELIAAGAPAQAIYEHAIARGRSVGDAGRAGHEATYERAELEAGRTYRVGKGLTGHGLGPGAAPLTIVVFSDFQCPFCRQVLPTLGRILQAYPDQVRLEFRHLPLAFHPDAHLAAEAAVVAGRQGKFWELHNLLFENQKALGRADLERYAQEAGLDMARFRTALDDRRYQPAVAAEVAAAHALGISGTPTMFVNGAAVTGAQPFEQLQPLLDEKLAEARRLESAGVPREDVYGFLMRRADVSEVGDRSRLGTVASIGLVELESHELTAAVRSACRAGDAERASSLYAGVRAADRERVRAGCRTYGVDLGD